MSILFWINDDCVLTLNEQSIYPRNGEEVTLHVQGCEGYYVVDDLLWSYRTIPTAIEGSSFSDNRLEIHLKEKK